MEWMELFPKDIEPSIEAIESYIGEALPLYRRVTGEFEQVHKAKPKKTFSGCSGKPGWNVKYQKSGQSFGTLYPESDAFSVLFVISYALDPFMREEMSNFSPTFQRMYEEAQDYMKMGRFFMFQMTEELAEDYVKVAKVKMDHRKR